MQPPYSRQGAQALYGNFLGLDRWGDPIVDPTTGQATMFMNSGDPVINSGWIYEQSCEVYFVQGSGPFSMAPMDTQRVLYAIVIGHSSDRLSSVIDLRRNADFIRNGVKTEFALKVTTEAQPHFISDSETQVFVQSHIIHENDILTVQADFYTYHQQHIHSMPLLDDGQVDNGIAGDHIFGNTWPTAANDSVLYVTITITDNSSQQFQYRYADYNITLSDKISLNKLTVVDDHINQDAAINPGENVRLGIELKNNYNHTLNNLKLFLETDDPYINLKPKTISIDSLPAGETSAIEYDLYDENSYFEVDIAADVPDSHRIELTVHILDEKFHHWTRSVILPVEPLEYEPNLIFPSQISGRSDAYFAVKVIYPAQLTGHSYWLTVSDSIDGVPGRGFNLIDQTLGVYLLKNHQIPDEHAFNIPITDGFKVVEVYLPDGGLKDVYYKNIESGHEPGFEIIIGSLGNAKPEEIYAVELVFKNEIDSSGIVGNPAGQYAYQYLVPNLNQPAGFLRCPFEVWKLSKGNRLNLLAVCFQENPFFSSYDDQWAPDASSHGGMEILYIMKSDYDPSGSQYQGKNLDLNNVMYKLHLRLTSEDAVVDIGDKIIFDWEVAASNKDVFAFVPTSVNQQKTQAIDNFMLYQNYPNPFNAATTIKFSINQPARLSLKIYNIMGQEIAQLLNQPVTAGVHSLQWDGSDKFSRKTASGLYFASLKSGNNVKLVKMLLIQ